MAIALDATSSSGEQDSVSSITLAHTVGTLSNGILILASGVRNSAVAYRHITGVTWNGSENFTVGKLQDGPAASRFLTGELWYLKAPSSGTHNIVVSYDGTVLIAEIGGISLSGVDQSNPIDATAGLSTTTGNPWTTSITTVANNSWIVNAIYTSSDNAILTNNSETSFFNVVTANVDQVGGAYRGPITPAGGTTTGWKNSPTGNDEGAMAVISLKPFVSTAVNATGFMTPNTSFWG